jgi:hypothetical protein
VFGEFFLIHRIEELAEVKNSIETGIAPELFDCFAVILQALVPQIGRRISVITTGAKRSA